MKHIEHIVIDEKFVHITYLDPDKRSTMNPTGEITKGVAHPSGFYEDLEKLIEAQEKDGLASCRIEASVASCSHHLVVTEEFRGRVIGLIKRYIEDFDFLKGGIDEQV